MDITAYVPSASVRRARRLFGGAGLAFTFQLLTALTLIGCDAKSNPEARSAPATLRMGVAVPNDALLSVGSGLIAEPLVGIGWDGRPVDRVVSTWEWSADRLALTLHLRPGLKFHDGTPVDLAYFKQTLENTIKQRSGNVSYASIRSIEVDPATPDAVVVRLTRPEAFLVTDLANSSLRHPTNNQVGTGPYMLESAAESKLRLKSFKDYYRGEPQIQAVEIDNFGEMRTSWAALLRGDIDAVHEILPNAVDFIDPRLRPYPFLRPYYLQLVFNVRHPLLRESAVRQALSFGVDRQGIIDHALNKQGTVAEGPIWPFHWAYSTAQKTYTHNTEAATLRLDALGLKLKDSRSGRMPSRLHIRCLTVEKNAQFEKLALNLQKQLYEIGVDLEIEALPVRELTSRLEAGDFETVLIQRTSGRSLAWTYLSFHSSVSPGGYRSVDRILDRLRQTTSDAEIRTAVSDLQQVFYDDPPAIFLAWPKVARVVNSRFAVPDEAGRDVLSSLWQWRPAEPSQ